MTLASGLTFGATVTGDTVKVNIMVIRLSDEVLTSASSHLGDRENRH